MKHKVLVRKTRKIVKSALKDTKILDRILHIINHFVLQCMSKRENLLLFCTCTDLLVSGRERIYKHTSNAGKATVYQNKLSNNTPHGSCRVLIPIPKTNIENFNWKFSMAKTQDIDTILLSYKTARSNSPAFTQDREVQCINSPI